MDISDHVLLALGCRPRLNLKTHRAMSVFSLEAAHGNPVTSETVDRLCSQLGVSIDPSEKEAYTRLLAVFHDASEHLISLEGKSSPEC